MDKIQNLLFVFGVLGMCVFAMFVAYILTRKCKYCGKIVWFDKNTCKESRPTPCLTDYTTYYWHRNCDKER